MTCNILYNSISIKCHGILESQLHYGEFMYIIRAITLLILPAFHNKTNHGSYIKHRIKQNALRIYLFICTVSLALHTVHYRRQEENYYGCNKRLRELHSRCSRHTITCSLKTTISIIRVTHLCHFRHFLWFRLHFRC
jgi:hypothetical protein